MPPVFTLTQQFALGAYYTWRLKDSEIRFRGGGEYKHLVLQRIRVFDEQIASFFSALDLIQAWNWREDYKSEDIGQVTMDGSWWTFSATFENRSCHSQGENAYPSYADALVTTLDLGRFCLLRAAMYDCFKIDEYIRQAKRFTVPDGLKPSDLDMSAES